MVYLKNIVSKFVVLTTCFVVSHAAIANDYTFEPNEDNFYELGQKVLKVGKKDVFTCENNSDFHIVYLNNETVALRPWHDDINPKYVPFKKSTKKDAFLAIVGDENITLTFSKDKKQMIVALDNVEETTCAFKETSELTDSWY